MVDKNLAKKYVSDRIGEEYIIPTLGVFDTFDKIDFDALPSKFVIKTTHDSGGVVVCNDENNFDVASAERIITKSLEKNYYSLWREWPYKNVKPQILVEEILYIQRWWIKI